MKRLRIGIVGAGGVGGYIAAKLVQKDLADVTLFARGRHLDAIRQKGLVVEDAGASFTVHPDTNPPPKGSLFDAVFIAVKSYDLSEACATIAPFVGKETLLIPLLNGVDHSRRIAKQLHEGLFCEGCVHVISHLAEPGRIVKKSPLFYLIFGCGEQNAHAKRVAQLLQESGLKTKLSDDARYDCWKKYLFIATFATLTTYYDLPMDAVYAQHREEVDRLLGEIKAVANALGVPLTDADIQSVHKQARNLPAGAKTSMQRDFEEGRKSELETLSGYIVEAAKAHGIETELMAKRYAALKARSEA